MTIASRSLAPLVTRRAQARLGIALVIPVMVMTVLFFIFPMVNALYYSVVDFNGVNQNPPFVGLDNFTKMFSDPKMWHALGNNVIWIIVGTISPMVIGILVAVLLWTVKRGAVIYRVIFFLPYVLPGVAIGIVWGWIYDPVHGLLNEFLKSGGGGVLATRGLGEPHNAI